MDGCVAARSPLHIINVRGAAVKRYTPAVSRVAPAFRATIRRSYIGKYNFVLCRVWRCYTPVRMTSSCAKSLRILAHVPAGDCSLARFRTRRGSRGRVDPLSIRAIAQHGAARCGAAWWRRYLSPSARRGGSKFTIYVARSISICINSKCAGKLSYVTSSANSFSAGRKGRLKIIRRRGMRISHCATRSPRD